MNVSKLTADVDALLGMFQLQHFTFPGSDMDEKIAAFGTILREENLSEQLDDVCRLELGYDYAKDLIMEGRVDHMITLRVNRVLIAFVLCSEKRVEMEVQVLCTREYSHTGRFMMDAVEKLALKKGLGTVTVSAIPSAIYFYDKLGYNIGTNCEKNSILDVARGVERLRHIPKKNEGSLPEVDPQISTLLYFFGYEKDEIGKLKREYPLQFEEWRNAFHGVEMKKISSSGGLKMSKCLT